MKVKKTFLLLFFIPFLLTGDVFGQMVSTGKNSAATELGLVKYYNLDNPTQSNRPRVQISTNGPKTDDQSFNWTSTQDFTIHYNGSQLSSKIMIGAAEYTLNHNCNLGLVNYFEFDVKANQDSSIIRLKNIKVGSYQTDDFEFHKTNSTKRIEGLSFTGSFTISGTIELVGGQGANTIDIMMGRLPVDTENEKPVVTILSAPDVEEGKTFELAATVDDSNTGNSFIKSAEYSFNNINWVPMSGVFDSSSVTNVTASITGLGCGSYTIYVRGTDAANNVSDPISTEFIVYNYGSISGVIKVGSNPGSPVGGVVVNLSYPDGSTKDVMTSVADGTFLFDSLLFSDYQVEIVIPLGFSITGELTREITIDYCQDDEVVNYIINPIEITNNAQGKGYWKHQFDVKIKGKGNAQESWTNMENYIGLIGNHYINHFDLIFDESYNPVYWSDILSYGGNIMYKKAMAHLAALVFNLASLKISQAESVGMGRDVADVISHASTILSQVNPSAADLELAKNICEAVNNHQNITVNIPDYNIVYKNGLFNTPAEYSLSANYPNPFNPSTMITYTLPEAGFVTLKVYDILGNEISTLVNSTKEAGIHNVSFDAASLSTGVYIYQIRAGNFSSTRKMLLSK